MAVYPHPRHPALLVAYTWWGTRVLTPRWFDDNDFALVERRPVLGRAVLRVWVRCRSLEIVRMRYWGRA